MRELLLVSRNFAPTSHVSVERAIKLAKYLPEFGWRPTVLAGVASPGLPDDPVLLNEVKGIEVLRSRAPELSLFYGDRPRRGTDAPSRRGAPRRGMLHPKSWLIPDSQLLWYPFAVRAALRHSAAQGRRRSASGSTSETGPRWDAVVATSFPPTALLIAHTVSRRLGIPYVADFRDSWTRFPNAPIRPPPLAALERRLERRVVRDAAAVVAVDAATVTHVFDRLSPAERPPLYVIQNGYDEEDFQRAVPVDLPRFSIVHTGQLFRSPEPLWAALAEAIRRRPALRGQLHFWQVGFVAPGAVEALGGAPEGVTVHVIPPVPQREAVGYMVGADLLVVEEYCGIMPSKTLQYLRAGRPILGLLDQGRLLGDVLGDLPGAHAVSRDDPALAGAVVAELADRPRGAPRPPDAAVAAYSRREVAARYAALLDAACAGPGATAAGPRSARPRVARPGG
jgi:glycosyltransferase involved in cell wall biosynthesis